MKKLQSFSNTINKFESVQEGSLDRDWFAAELEFPKILVPRIPQYTSNVNIKYARKSEWSKQLYYLYGTSFLQHWYILILLFWYYLFLIEDALRKLCNIWLLLCESNSRSITLPELHAGGKYYCSYYSRQGDRWQFEKAN